MCPGRKLGQLQTTIPTLGQAPDPIFRIAPKLWSTPKLDENCCDFDPIPVNVLALLIHQLSCNPPIFSQSHQSQRSTRASSRDAARCDSNHIDRRPTTALGPAPKPSTHDPSRAGKRAHIQNSNIHLSTPRGGGGGRAPVVNPRLYIYSHTSARVLVMGVHTSRL